MDHENDDSIHKKGRHRKKQLYNSILQQMEFYFSDSNLAKDRYLSQLINDDPYIDVSHFLKFNKIRKLTTSVDDIKKAILKSDIIEFSEDKEKIRRKTPIYIKENVDDCTIYIERIKSDTTHEFLTNIFSDFGKVVYVSIPKYKHNNINKGFAFIEFDSEKGAEDTVSYFESIGCKMSSNVNPEELCSISSFVKDKEKNIEGDILEFDKHENQSTNKRKMESTTEGSRKKIKQIEHEISDIESSDKVSNTEQDGEKVDELTTSIKSEDVSHDDCKKKKKKEHKKRNFIKELGILVLMKKDWKKMRNRYLDLQRKKMKDFKIYLNRSKFSSQSYKDKSKMLEPPGNITTSFQPKLNFESGVIVKINLNDFCEDPKKLKNDIKILAEDIQYVDAQIGSKEVFVRFANNNSSGKFVTCEFNAGTKHILEGEAETLYWEKIRQDRSEKFSKEVKKQRGKDKLLKKAEKVYAQHIRFDGLES